MTKAKKHMNEYREQIKTVVAGSIAVLDFEVNELLKQGWYIMGAPFIFKDRLNQQVGRLDSIRKTTEDGLD